MSTMEIVKVSGSTLDRVVRCQASAALPQIVDQDDTKPNQRRDEGIAVDKFIERVSKVGRDAALLEVDVQYRDICADVQIAKLTAQLRMSHQVTFVYNWRDDTSRIAEVIEGERVVVDRTCEVVFRVDVTGLAERERKVYVGDYKRVRGWLPAPEHSYQLAGGAVAAARYFNARSAFVEYIRIRDDGSIGKFGNELDMLALDAAAEKIAATMRGAMELRERVIGGLVPNVTEGGWCRYCPAKQHCPAKTALARHVLTDPVPVPYTIPLTPERAREAYVLLKKAKDAIKTVESAIHAYVKFEPIFLGEDEDGSERWFGELSRPGDEKLDGRITHQIITGEYGGAAANEVVTMEATKKAITEAIKKYKPGDATIVSEQKKIHKAITEAGGVSRPTTCTTIEYTISPDGDTKARKRKAAS